MADQQEKHNANLIYWEKMKEVRHLTFYLHVIAGTLVCVEYPSIVEKELVKDHILGFIHIFFFSIESLYCYFVISTALSLPPCGSIEFILAMVFNGVVSYHYVSFVNRGRAIFALLLWTISAGLILLFTVEESWKQLYKWAATTIERLWFIVTKIWEGITFLVTWCLNKLLNQVQQNRNQDPQDPQAPQDPQDIFNRNYFYFEKQRELRNITMWLHVISGTLVTLENPLIGVKQIMESLNFSHFIHPFFKGIQILYLYYVLSIALCPPQSGTLEFVLVMIFNAITSRFYVNFSDKKLAKIVFKIWSIGAGCLLSFTMEDTVKQIWGILISAKDRMKNIKKMVKDTPKNTRKWLYDH